MYTSPSVVRRLPGAVPSTRPPNGPPAMRSSIPSPFTSPMAKVVPTRVNPSAGRKVKSCSIFAKSTVPPREGDPKIMYASPRSVRMFVRPLEPGAPTTTSSIPSPLRSPLMTETPKLSPGRAPKMVRSAVARPKSMSSPRRPEPKITYASPESSRELLGPSPKGAPRSRSSTPSLLKSPRARESPPVRRSPASAGTMVRTGASDAMSRMEVGARAAGVGITVKGMTGVAVGDVDGRMGGDGDADPPPSPQPAEVAAPAASKSAVRAMNALGMVA